MASRYLPPPFRTGSDSVVDSNLRRCSVGLRQPSLCCHAPASEGNEQVLIADFSQSVSVPQQLARPLVTRATTEPV
ncbi:unnamed protein product [Soboliphyme baturini]|uniref:Uncharacterized protein n=1 Tax=Soboliphyme baturini TaxID=241478 RepID=A0A183IQ27_9BILA|nr:unnamed protein product [Soboliphyme baturini]